MSKTITVIGGGAAGVFAAINCKLNNQNNKVIVLEKSQKLLQKVKVSGGGRCNVTHACFDPKELTQYYPRGEKELLGPFHQFAPGDMFEWLGNLGVNLKIEDDNRVFPDTDDSQTIIDCFTKQLNKLGIEVKYGEGVTAITKTENNWQIKTSSNSYESQSVIIASGSSNAAWKLIKELGHSIVEPLPSLFTFNINDTRIKEIPGISVPNANVRFNSLESAGPLLITHWGMSGPAILKLSAWGARDLHKVNYQFTLQVNWLGDYDYNDCIEALLNEKQKQPRQKVMNNPLFMLPKRLWNNLCMAAKIPAHCNWADVSNKHLENLSQQLTLGRYHVNGKSTFKEEFVTCGGVELKEINFKTFESKICPGIYFAGEVLNIDAVTGGFNFQAAWTGAWIAAKHCSD